MYKQKHRKSFLIVTITLQTPYRTIHHWQQVPWKDGSMIKDIVNRGNESEVLSLTSLLCEHQCDYCDLIHLSHQRLSTINNNPDSTHSQ